MTNYRERWFMDMWLEAEPIGQDPATGWNVYYGDATELCCLLIDRPEEVPF